MFKRTLGLIFLIISLSYPQGQNPGAVFLMIWPGARPTSLAGAFTSVADDASTIYYNVGGLGFINSTYATLMHCNWLPGLYPGMYYEYLGVTHSIKERGTAGFNVIYLNTGETPVINEQGEELGQYTTFDLSAGIAYGFKVFPRLSAGVGFKFIYSFLVPEWVWQAMPELGIESGGTGTTWGIDFGLLYKPLNKLTIGTALANIGPNISYTSSGESDPIPRMLRLGLKYEVVSSQLVKLTINPEITKVLVGMFYDPEDRKTFGQELQYELWEAWKHFGIEFGYYDFLFARLGYFEDLSGARGGIVVEKKDKPFSEHISIFDFLFRTNQGKFKSLGLTFGGGLKFKKFLFDISLDHMIYDFPTQNYKFSLSYQF